MDNSIAVSSWTLHREVTARGLAAVLQDIPATGLERVEICHFHLEEGFQMPSDLHLQSLLIDDGDLTNPTDSARWMAWILEQVQVAANLGAEHARVIAGKTVGPGSVSLAAERVLEVAAVAKRIGVRVSVENWFDVLGTPEAMNEFLDLCGDEVAFNVDLGNWPSPQKYEWLPQVFGRASLCHAKCEFLPDGAVDLVDYHRCLGFAKASGYQGPLTIVNGGSGNEWDALRKTVAAIQAA